MGSNKTSTPPDLGDLREKIDAVDERLLELLAQRSALVNQVVQAKRASGQAHILRPAREAQQMRKFIDWHSRNAADMPLAGFQAVWREIISSSVSQQNPLTVYCADSVHDVAKAQFGQAAQYVAADTTAGLLAALAGTPHAIGVMDMQMDGFLPQLHAAIQAEMSEPLQVFLGLPLFDATAQIVCLGRIPVEASGQDKTLLIGPEQELPASANILAREQGIGLAMMDGFMTQEALDPAARQAGIVICGTFPLVDEQYEGQA